MQSVKYRTEQQNKSKPEIWRDIVGYEGKYQVSNLGRIKSLSRKRGANKGGSYITKEKIMVIIHKKIGYSQITLTKNNIQNRYLIHRLVAYHFLDNPNNKLVVNHKDGNGFNNNIKNLEWCNVSENALHAHRILGHKVWHKGRQGERTPTSKPILQKNFDGSLIKRWSCGLDAVRSGKFESSCICRCCKGEQKTHHGYIWEYAN